MGRAGSILCARPGGFPTSLDVLHCQCGDLDANAADRLNRRFWDKFDRTDWGRTKIIVAYMLEDDYDGTAYGKLMEHLHSIKRGIKSSYS